MWYFQQEEKEIQELCKDFAKNEIAPLAHKHDREETFNLDAFRKMGEVGILGILAPTEYGGSGMGAVASTISMVEIGKACASTALSYLAHSILCINNIVNNADSSQKEKYLPDLISGKAIGSMGMSEADFGSDALGMQTKAERRGESYIINGSKMWITNGQIADYCYLYAKTGPNKKDVSSFIFEKDTKGFSVGKDIHKMGMKASPTGELIYNNCIIPMENRVGAENSSTYQMMKNLEIERITIAGISLGIAEACLESSTIYAKERVQFGKKIGQFQLIQKMLSDMKAHVEMMKSYLYSAAKEFELGKRGASFAACVKLAIPRMVTQIALDAIQLHGGYGYAQEFPVERYLRDAKLMEIGAGTNEIMTSIIAKEILRN